MTINKKLLTLAVCAIAIVVMVSAISGCSTHSSFETNTSTGISASTGTATSSPASGTTSTGTGTTPTVVSGPPQVSQVGDKYTIAGSQDGTVDSMVATGGYIVEVLAKDTAMVEMHTESGDLSIIAELFPVRSDGWHMYVRPEQYLNDEPIKITATGPYVITMTKLPLAATADSTPKTYKGLGNNVVGPFTLTKGTVTLKGVSGKTVVNLYDATTGEAIGTQNDLYTGSPGGISPVDATVNVPETGSYLLQVRLSDYSNWELTVSQ